MPTIEITEECKKMLDYYVNYYKDLGVKQSYSEIIIEFKEEVFLTRMRSIKDSDFGR